MDSNIPKNKAIDIEEVARMWRKEYNEEFPGIVDTYGFIHGTPQQTKQQNTASAIPKRERSTDELIAEAQKIINRKESIPTPVTEGPKPQQKPINEIKRFSELLKDAKTTTRR